MIHKYYQLGALSAQKLQQALDLIRASVPDVKQLETEYCYYVDSTGQFDETKLRWILSHGFDIQLTPESSFQTPQQVVEIGPRLNFSTPFSTNAVSIAHSISLTTIVRIEKAIRYNVTLSSGTWNETQKIKIVNLLHDKMTECQYEEPITSFDLNIEPQPWSEIDILGEGRTALLKANDELGLAFDTWDIDYYTNLFKNVLKRNPTSVECFDLAQSNSEHSRHWFFKGRMIIDGKEIKESLIDLVMATQKKSYPNSIIAFSDNSSAIEGFEVKRLVPTKPGYGAEYALKKDKQHIIFTAETHNFPTGVAPFSGATTGTGGRIRDVQAAGRGSHVVAGTAGYSFGNLNIPGYELPWEEKSWDYPSNFAPPLQIAIEASNGASDYGNKFGEPIISGFARSFGLKLNDGTRREYIKPIMFTGGIGRLNAGMEEKDTPEPGMLVVKIGGPVYRIGVGGGSASSVHVQGDQKEELDFGAVQRGDAEMEQKLNRVIRACIELGDKNVIRSIHDQGAGGNGNVLKEIVEPVGAEIYIDQFELGDPTLSVMEIWGAEYQESDAVLIHSKDRETLENIGKREKCSVSFVGKVTGDGRVVLKDSEKSKSVENKRYPVDLELKHVLASMPRKIFDLQVHKQILKPLSLPPNFSIMMALERVLRLPSVASKRYLTSKVDRSVTGLIAQQQCVGPLHTPLADCAVKALSHFETVGSATSIGEQPIKGLLDAAAGARMSVAESVTNLLFAQVSSLQHVKCSGNWMWAAKLPGEGAALCHACVAMTDTMGILGIAIDGGKDSLSMAARVEEETVKAPGTLVVSSYVGCTDITKNVTPDLKVPNNKGALIWINLASFSKGRLGGSAFAQCFKQLGDEVADLENPLLLRDGFAVTQELLRESLIVSGHDVSDGGLLTCVLEMAFAGNCGLDISLDSSSLSLQELLFGEEVGWVIEVAEKDVHKVLEAYSSKNVPCKHIGYSQGFGPHSQVNLQVNNEQILLGKTSHYRDIWEETSMWLDKRQTTPACVDQEYQGLKNRTAPPFALSFIPNIPKPLPSNKPLVAVLREEGTNGDQEMVASFFMAGFDVFDLTMSDLITGKVTVDRFRGLVFPGGFSYGDVLGSARGWASGLLFHDNIKSQLEAFRKNPKTFSLGVCNGCQLLALLGWVGSLTKNDGSVEQGLLLNHNLSERFESRFTACLIEKSPSLMFKDMEGSILGVWVAHGEGRFTFKNQQLESLSSQYTALRYVDDTGKPTTVYPFNPNGSISGLAGMCSPDGRHLAVMPHPERCTQMWQWPWTPKDWQVECSPWVKMFSNAYEWCLKNE